jgi:hypothetical protein
MLSFALNTIYIYEYDPRDNIPREDKLDRTLSDSLRLKSLRKDALSIIRRTFSDLVIL